MLTRESTLVSWLDERTDSISEAQQREIFRVLVETQDDGITVLESREQIAGQYNINVDHVVDIERIGVKAKWPPLDITFPADRFAGDSPQEVTG